MELNQAAFDQAYLDFYVAPSGRLKADLAAAIKTYLTADLTKPGLVMELPLDPIPQRDYRKEAWIAAISQGGQNYCTEVLKAFDATFPPEPTHG